MQLQLRSVIPIPLKDRLSLGQSGVWGGQLDFSSPEYLFIQAPSGTGKTTLIHALYGLRNDYEGQISWGGHNMKETAAEQTAALRSRELSIIFQDMRLFPELTAWENLELKRGLTDTVTQETVHSWMQQLGIGDKMQALARTLSYGEQQRVAIIRALVQPFRWLLMDEPFSHLDKRNTAIAAALIAGVAQSNQAGLILADLDENDFFPYHKTLFL